MKGDTTFTVARQVHQPCPSSVMLGVGSLPHFLLISSVLLADIYYRAQRPHLSLCVFNGFVFQYKSIAMPGGHHGNIDLPDCCLA